MAPRAAVQQLLLCSPIGVARPCAPCWQLPRSTGPSWGSPGTSSSPRSRSPPPSPSSTSPSQATCPAPGVAAGAAASDGRGLGGGGERGGGADDGGDGGHPRPGRHAQQALPAQQVGRGTWSKEEWWKSESDRDLDEVSLHHVIGALIKLSGDALVVAARTDGCFLLKLPPAWCPHLTGAQM